MFNNLHRSTAMTGYFLLTALSFRQLPTVSSAITRSRTKTAAFTLSQQKHRNVQRSIQIEETRLRQRHSRTRTFPRCSSRRIPESFPPRSQPVSSRMFSTAPEENKFTQDNASADGSNILPLLRRRVCILQDDNFNDNCKLFEGVYHNLSEALSLPLVIKSQLINEKCNNTATDVQSESFTHALCLVEYPNDAVHLKIEPSQQYALAIQPLLPLEEINNSQKKRDRRGSKQNPKKSLHQALKIKPHWIDLCPMTALQRTGQPDLLLQAVSPQRVKRTSSDGGNAGAVIFDLTAGWAQDSLLLATSPGVSRVVMVERDPIVACLLQDALRRVELIATGSDGDLPATSWQRRARELQKKLQLRVGDARDILQQSLDALPNQQSHSEEQPDIVYLDPMFPPRTKAAATKKGMQILHGLFTPASSGPWATDVSLEDIVRETEEAELLQLAHAAAKAKVVVKRPISAPTLGGDQSRFIPSNTVKGSINRWDIYVKAA